MKCNGGQKAERREEMDGLGMVWLRRHIPNTRSRSDETGTLHGIGDGRGGGRQIHNTYKNYEYYNDHALVP